MKHSRGLRVEDQLNPTAWRFGGVTGITPVVLQEDRDFGKFLPKYEAQYDPKFDTMACVPFSALNCVETMLIRKYGVERNFSDRFTAKLSGTTINGNYFSAVADSITTLHGIVFEESWPWDVTFDWDTFYLPVPSDVREVGKVSLKTYRIKSEVVWDNVVTLYEALKYSPLQVAIHAYGEIKDDIYQRTEAQGNHAVELFKAVKDEYWVIYDHYERKFKKLAWNTRFWGALRYDIELITNTPAPMPELKILNNTLVQEVEQSGTFGLYLDGKIFVDDRDAILATYEMRNTRQVGTDADGNPQYQFFPKAMALKLEQWNHYPKFNLKNQPL